MVSDLSAEEALSRLDPHEREWVETFRDRVRAELGERVRDLRIFGSKVRGESHDESDIDLLVLLDDADWETQKGVVLMASEISTWLSPKIFTFDSYHAPMMRASGFYKEMRKESVRL